ncbi:nuclear transport factor 2 family protein [Streptomyces sp. NPDC019890]|uniref:nuclear transport factor 2 family protein n=1 Tax=Streptomyces sp. NPDC019890 TaxID=3365064 RepID=UPI00384D1508
MSPDTNHTPTVRGTVETFLRLIAEGDADRIADNFAEEIDWFVPGGDKFPWAGHRSQRQQVPEYFKTMWSAFVPGTAETTIHNILVDGSDAVVLGRFGNTMEATGRRFSAPVAVHLTVENGRIVRLHLYEDTYAIAYAYGADD